MGKAFFSSTLPPLDINAENPLCRFKTIGYSTLPSTLNEDGLVGGIVSKKSSDLNSQRDQIASAIHGALGKTRALLHRRTIMPSFHLVVREPRKYQSERR